MLFVTASCAPQVPRPVLLTAQSRLGLADGFGPGIVSATNDSMAFQLDAPAHVIVLRVMNDMSIEQVHPVGPSDPEVPRGTHAVMAPSQPGIVPGHGRVLSRRENQAGYWLLIMSDTRTLPFELEARIQALKVDTDSLPTLVRQVPGALIGGRTTNWSAYYLGFVLAKKPH